MNLLAGCRGSSRHTICMNVTLPVFLPIQKNNVLLPGEIPEKSEFPEHRGVCFTGLNPLFLTLTKLILWKTRSTSAGLY